MKTTINCPQIKLMILTSSKPEGNLLIVRNIIINYGLIWKIENYTEN